ncbi:MAG: ribosome assembly cofactor RimP [Bacteroidia bacterium]|nr:ribosome assembly cofactor RimP [Bacteroidia bacterium]MBT8278572.1 ribosome assembly cofactor RimP [Bacteroidia bacterium]NNK59534.1 ribosome assembly cofactor RimP [Flavobacteriaceae bacterium]NNL32598.1 ribosome assembly cofactor RimP [Flavobacteriaceae bacterium]RZW43787.1 MAG: ribosome assembly cofactor RimP [Flavobacteriaceae bacterium]
MFEKKVRELLEQSLAERGDLFLIDFSVSNNNAINIVIDGDHGVVVDDCVFISRGIEHNLDREEFDFSLEVASAGAATPLTHLRQYKKNIGRTLEVKTKDQKKYEGQLVDADEKAITLNWKTREPKPVGKGKVTVSKEAKLDYETIEKAKVKIKF